jgi:hypothetical protein
MKRKRRLSQQDLRLMGATPGLMANRVGPDGRARLEELTAESGGRSPFFKARRLTSRNEDTKDSEGSMT